MAAAADWGVELRGRGRGRGRSDPHPDEGDAFYSLETDRRLARAVRDVLRDT